MKSTLVFALALAGIPAAAQAQAEFNENAGAWRVKGSGTSCIAANAQQAGMVMVTAPAPGGQHVGGFMVTARNLNVPDGPGATIEMKGAGPFAGVHRATGYSDVPAYWTPFTSADILDSLPDGFGIKVVRDGQTQVDVSVTGFSEARKALRRCMDWRRSASGGTG